MPYCEKCGQKMSDDAVFCSRCGRKATVATNIRVEENKLEEYKFDEPEVTETDAVAEVEEKKGLSTKSKRIITVAAIALTLIVVVLTLFFVLRDNNKVVTKNEDGETVFAFTFSEFIDRYNENAPDKFFSSDFEKDGEGYTMNEGDLYISIDIDKGNNPCYVKDIYFAYYGNNRKVPDEAVALVMAIYPKMKEKEAYDKLEDLMIKGNNADFDYVWLFYDNETDHQSWHFIPDDV